MELPLQVFVLPVQCGVIYRVISILPTSQVRQRLTTSLVSCSSCQSMKARRSGIKGPTSSSGRSNSGSRLAASRHHKWRRKGCPPFSRQPGNSSMRLAQGELQHETKFKCCCIFEGPFALLTMWMYMETACGWQPLGKGPSITNTGCSRWICDHLAATSPG